MPAHINYETTPIIFYKFVCENPEIKSTYVGQTSNFMERKRHHKYNCNNELHRDHNYKIYKTIRENGGWDNWKMIEIDRQICLDKSHACKIEQKYIEELQANMNLIYASRSDEQYRLDNKEQINKNSKLYRLNNKEKRSETIKTYYLNNKEKIQKKQIQKFNCECGGECNIYTKQRHFKSKKHLAYLETLKITL